MFVCFKIFCIVHSIIVVYYGRRCPIVCIGYMWLSLEIVIKNSLKQIHRRHKIGSCKIVPIDTLKLCTSIFKNISLPTLSRWCTCVIKTRQLVMNVYLTELIIRKNLMYRVSNFKNTWVGIDMHCKSINLEWKRTKKLFPLIWVIFFCTDLYYNYHIMFIFSTKRACAILYD